MVGSAEYEAGRGGVLRGPRPPMAAPARVESDAVATSFFGCSEDHSSFNHPANGTKLRISWSSLNWLVVIICVLNEIWSFSWLISSWLNSWRCHVSLVVNSFFLNRAIRFSELETRWYEWLIYSLLCLIWNCHRKMFLLKRHILDMSLNLFNMHSCREWVLFKHDDGWQPSRGIYILSVRFARVSTFGL